MCLRLLLPNLATEGNTLSKLLLRMALQDHLSSFPF